MSEYIKREDAIRAIMEYIRDGCDESDEFIDGTYKAKLIVEEDIPPADVVEVRHGRWEIIYKHSEIATLVKCSECGHERYIQTGEEVPKYCPHCGARMDGEEE